MKKLFLVALAVVGMTTFAQEPKRDMKEKLTPEQRVEFQVKKMAKDLSLTDKQIEQVRALVKKEVDKREAKRAEMEARRAENQRPTKEEKDARRDEMKANAEAMKAEMKKILTAEQYAKWEQKLAERKEKMMKRIEERKGESMSPSEMK
ncbi:DUF4890 domain-containing protein [Flavobacterium aciduliphilum]|uniref:Uncharacterized protein DUF4890 n=1 Tax=Flavobacterium aciduliphilum TaxID=1101402 RepID=A0A328YAR0_9FLAO|nr:DUF4890 domain-containing protein [Flavobacterium aciduliphilum]RAR69268.1 uncharacterized protein DUF4890 [Flavobacterium aciduliphilum]